jgi:hypothetical protein
MKSNFRTLLSIAFWFTIIATPLRAGEQLHYLPHGKPDAIITEAMQYRLASHGNRPHYPTDIYAGRVLAQVIKK